MIARHGDTFEPGEPPRRIGSRTDLPLTANGRRQACQLGHALTAAGFAFGAALTGPLDRARLTAQLLLSVMPGAPQPSVIPLLNEVDHGPDEDQPEAAVLARSGADALAAWDDEASPPLGWIVDRDARLEWWRTLFDAPPPGDTLIVTSNGSARFALLAMNALRRPTSLKLRTGAFGVLRRDLGHTWTVDVWNMRPGEAGEPTCL